MTLIAEIIRNISRISA